MRLETATNNDCVAASLAMLFDLPIDHIKGELFPSPTQYPFPEPWDGLPRVPSMEEIVHWAYRHRKVGLVPFPYHPYCSPHPDCPGVAVWPDQNPDKVFAGQLSHGKGVIEGVTETGSGHMVAWDGTVIYDPRGYLYSLNVVAKFGFEPSRFWLAVEKP